MGLKMIDQKDYTHYVLVFKNGDPIIESGWSFPEDAREHVREDLPKKLISKTVSRKRMPLDPKQDSNWLKGSVWGQELYFDR